MSENLHPTVSSPKRLSRREVLIFSWLGLLSFLVVKFFNLGGRIAVPVRKESTYGGVFQMGSVEDLPGVGEPPFSVPEGKFWLVRTEAGLLALHKVCTHLDCLCDWNAVTENFVCPCHGSEFELDGDYQKGPAGRSLDRFVVRLVNKDGNLVAETDPSSGAPLPIPVTGLNTTEQVTSENGESTESELFVEVDTGIKIRGIPVD